MRILLAVDGSPSSRTAVHLVDHLEWPSDTLIRIVSVLDTDRLYFPFAGEIPVDLTATDTVARADLNEITVEAAATLQRPGRRIERSSPAGRPSSAILHEAANAGADLIVVGSRGRGPWRTMLLGSVSAEVLDGAHCPVLVARTEAVTRAILAHDGSASAAAAEDVIGVWPIFVPVAIQVLSVFRPLEQSLSEPFSVVLPEYDRVLENMAREVAAARHHHEQIARTAAERLRKHALNVNWDVREGDPAHAIVDEAGVSGTDLIVMGTRGRTGLERLALGSVARNVLTQAHCSVLVVHGVQGARPATSV
jgi:nucleotide-binding universal stress UspA family protein